MKTLSLNQTGSISGGSHFYDSQRYGDYSAVSLGVAAIAAGPAIVAGATPLGLLAGTVSAISAASSFYWHKASDDSFELFLGEIFPKSK